MRDGEWEYRMRRGIYFLKSEVGMAAWWSVACQTINVGWIIIRANRIGGWISHSIGIECMEEGVQHTTTVKLLG